MKAIFIDFLEKLAFIYIFFFTVIAQLLLAIQYIKLKNEVDLNYRFIKFKLILSIILISFGIIILPVLIIKIESFPEIKNIISWNYFLLIQIYYLMTFLCWKPQSHTLSGV